MYAIKDNKKYYDINRLLNLLNETDRYNEYKKYIEILGKNDKNEIKEYINKETLFKIIVNSESEVSKDIKTELSVDLKIGSHDKDETYVFDLDLYKTYMDYVDKGEFNKVEIELEEENKKTMEEYFKNIDERYERELILKIKPSIEICKIKSVEQKEYAIELNSKYYNYMLMSQKESNRHKEVMKDKDIELKRIELEILKISKY